MLGIRVDRFGFGLPFGPTLWEKKIGDVTYCIHAFLLGGYVSFPDDDPDSDIPEDDPGRLKNRKVWEKALVISAGVTANALLAYIIVAGVIIYSGAVPTNQNHIYVNELSKDVQIAKQAGLQKGDKVFAINGVEIKSFNDFSRILQANSANDKYVFEKDVNKQLKNIAQANPQILKEIGFNAGALDKEDLKSLQETVIPKNSVITVPEIISEEFIVPDLKDPFAKPKDLPPSAALKESEVKLKQEIENNQFAGNGYTTFGEVAKAAADGKHVLTMTVLRGDEKVNLELSPNPDGIIGFVPRVEDYRVPLTSVGQVFTGAWDYIYYNTKLMCLGLYKIFTGQISLWNLHGILAITKIGGNIIYSKGMIDGWLLTALISIDLAIVNLLPIPALDGGHLFFLIIEKLRGKPVEDKYQEAFIKYGFLFLIGLMLFTIFNDIMGMVTGKF
jgi:regulator of sigma E protease